MRTALLLFVSLLFGVHAEYAMETLSESPRVYLIPDFLSDRECEHLIALAIPLLEPSTVLNEKDQGESRVLDSRRSSFSAFFPPRLGDPIVRKIEKRIAHLTNYPIENGESLQVVHYEKGGEYQPHYDYFPRANFGGAAALSRGGQRVATMILYLNTPEEGGKTIFPKINISVTPKKGNAVLFYNCREDGTEDPRTLHGGAPVKKGEKWIANKWIRQGVFH